MQCMVTEAHRNTNCCSTVTHPGIIGTYKRLYSPAEIQDDLAIPYKEYSGRYGNSDLKSE